MRLVRVLAALICMAPLAQAAADDVPDVVVSIMPVHAIATQVMDGVGEPTLLLRPGMSPHLYSMRPSEAAAVADADLVVWVGEGLETFLMRPLASLRGERPVLALQDVDGLELLTLRSPHDWTRGSASLDQVRNSHAAAHDLHVWLSPDNGRVIAEALAQTLASLDPENAVLYRQNAAAFSDKLDEVEQQIERRLEPVRDVPFLVMHDAFQYFERHFGLRAVGAVAVSPDLRAGAGRLAALRAEVVEDGVACVFTEPQLSDGRVDLLVEGSDTRVAALDPLGAGIEPGKNAYFQLLDDLAHSLSDCLARRS